MTIVEKELPSGIACGAEGEGKSFRAFIEIGRVRSFVGPQFQSIIEAIEYAFSLKDQLEVK